ncbi:MAG TPA: GNAT family N-acetyltransferase [Leptolyngbyaceae cyanobacterium M65_K2018_010]|nr:GNAT family N-acetyltransferase [Leptolyngbyaceae cyanobacterium M65_K2018_010]
MKIRLATETDLPTLARLYQQTVRVHAPAFYTPAQTAEWASFGADSQRFRHFILGVTTYVAEEATGLLGFAGFSGRGHIASVYVRHDWVRRGIGSRLLARVLSQAQQQGITRLYTEASEFSLGLFQKFGFSLYDTEWVDRGGVQFERYLLERIQLP